MMLLLSSLFIRALVLTLCWVSIEAFSSSSLLSSKEYAIGKITTKANCDKPSLFRRHNHRRRHLDVATRNSGRNYRYIPGLSMNNDNDYTSSKSDSPQYTDYDNREDSNRSNNGILLSPYQVLYPSLFSSSDNTIDIDETGIDRELPLHESINIIKRTLKRIADDDNDTILNDLVSHQPPSDDKNKKTLSKPRIIRLEHRISHTVDPLGWLHSQTSRNILLQQATSKNDKEPILYYANAEGTLEASVYGTAFTYKDALSPSSLKASRTTTQSSSSDFNIWNDIVSRLPRSSRLYGGERFDSSTHDNTNEWAEFSKGMWILPLIELRIEEEEERESTTKTSSTKTATIAVHLFNNNNYDSIDGWKKSAKNTLEKIKHISDTTSDCSPPTTLPPIISRDYFYTSKQKDKINSSDTEERHEKDDVIVVDGQEIFERGVNNALDMFDKIQSSNNQRSGENHNKSSDVSYDDNNDDCENTGHEFEKVVLARRMDINFSPYAKLNGLDIIRRWKYSSRSNERHEGHLLYLYPGSNEYGDSTSRKEFFGCTPERLFLIKKDGRVISEALAGTRPRGSTQEEDEALLNELFNSEKDQNENHITYKFIKSVFDSLGGDGLLVKPEKASNRLIDPDINKDRGNANNDLVGEGQIRARSSIVKNDRIFVRRLRHLQHICQRLEGRLATTSGSSSNHSCISSDVPDVTRQLLNKLHPTPAVCGFPKKEALLFIRDNEANEGFDRGYYSGPFGSIGRDSADIVVAIRSGLLSSSSTTSTDSEASYRGMRNDDENSDIVGATTISSTGVSKPLIANTKMSIFAGAGIVPGSTLQGEWVETSYKLGVLSSLFMPSPITLQGMPTPNVAWTTAFVEELIRSGVTQFYVCPGSRSTPLVGAIVKASRTHVGIVSAISIHDERSAAFRAVGYGRGSTNNKLAAVVTSSGTAVGNLYPAIIESSMDGVPLLVLTADRPYENRNTGANQAIDQVHAFSPTYVRWFRDIPPPNDDVPVSVALADASHAVQMSRNLRGPVHINIQFRENLAPDTGKVRNDNRVDSIIKYNGFRFTDVPGFQRWSTGGGTWLQSAYSNNGGTNFDNTVLEVVDLILKSERGLIVVGNIRSSIEEGESASNKDGTQLSDIISSFARKIGFPIMAGAQSGNLRTRSTAVIPYAEHILKHPTVSQNINPDLVIQIGSPMISTEIPNMIFRAAAGIHFHHVLLHSHHSQERADPNFTVTHKVSADAGPFLKAVSRQLAVLESSGDGKRRLPSSNLSPLVFLGRALGDQMPNIIQGATESTVSLMTASEGGVASLSEPQIILGLSEVLTDKEFPMALFLSNSMPIRDAEFFLYPKVKGTKFSEDQSVSKIGVNRGASGIDGIISTAAGFSDAMETPTTLLVGDVASLHDINALHSLSASKMKSPSSGFRAPSLTTIVVNNDGGGIFSFLPIAKHPKDFAFDEYFGTPTNSFSFEKGVEAFGLCFKKSSTYEGFKKSYHEALLENRPCVVEANVIGRELNVAVHKEITSRAVEFLGGQLGLDEKKDLSFQTKLPIKLYATNEIGIAHNDNDHLKLSTKDDKKERILLLLHGWMGDKTEWDEVGTTLVQSLPPEWNVISIDLPGHGDSSLYCSSESQSVRSALGIPPNGDSRSWTAEDDLSIDGIAISILRSLSTDHKIGKVDAVAGYSLGGRVALAMRRMSKQSPIFEGASLPALISDETELILLSSYPGELMSSTALVSNEIRAKAIASRMAKDDSLVNQVVALSNRGSLILGSQSENSLLWSDFLDNWYRDTSLWGNLQKNMSKKYRQMITKRRNTLVRRSRDVANVLKYGSPSRHSDMDWKHIEPMKTMFIAGRLDKKYSQLGKQWSNESNGLSYREILGVGHALLVEAPVEVAGIISGLLNGKESIKQSVELYVRQDETIKALVRGKKERVERIKRDSIYSDLCVPLPLSSSGDFYPCDLGSMDFEMFQIDLVSENRRAKGVFGIGWGASSQNDKRSDQRSGFILNIVSKDGSSVGIGESSPLPGLHPETLEEAKEQLTIIKSRLKDVDPDLVPMFNAKSILTMSGGLSDYISRLMHVLEVQNVCNSVRSGLEMALLSLAAQVLKTPVHQAMSDFSTNSSSFWTKRNSQLPLNGLITRRESRRSWDEADAINYPSLKVKVGHQSAKKDALALANALHDTEERHGVRNCRIRADANRAWAMDDAKDFVVALDRIGIKGSAQLEFIEEPLQSHSGDAWSLGAQIEELERWYRFSDIPYALDESMADLAKMHRYDFDAMERDIRGAFSGKDKFGCAAFVLKPALLGLEVSMRLARLARQELGIGAVFSSSFDSGIGLAYTAFLGAVSDGLYYASDNTTYAHGAGTFATLGSDTISPPFSSYVDSHGMLNIVSLSRALYGLGLDEIRETFVAQLPVETFNIPPEKVTNQQTKDYQSVAATSSSGREISVVVSLPLPFSDDIASSRFLDLPQQSRWSPWLASVAYIDAGQETEWTLNVRGVQLSWRAVSSVLEQPYRGIKWESVSGLKNMGIVEFIPTSKDSCLMKVKMTIITPRVVSALFRGTSVFIEDFLQNKLLKWSLEMFRDVVKGDLALERGDAELGDALFGAVEGRANAIEATLSYPGTSTEEFEE